MKISKAQLIEMKACTDGLERFIKQTNNTDEPVEVNSLIGGINTYSDLLWLADRTVDKSKIVRFACDCALINIDLIKPYTDQYDMIVEFLINPIVDTADIAVYAAAHAAAARAAYDTDAAHAAYDTDAAHAAANAANAADAANDDAAIDAAAAAYAANAANAAADAVDKVNELLIKLFKD